MADRPTPALMARPGPAPRPRVGRNQLLLDAIRAQGGQWTTGRAKAFFRKVYPTHVYRSTIRRQLRQLRDAGLLEQLLDGHGRRYYLYIPQGGADRG